MQNISVMKREGGCMARISPEHIVVSIDVGTTKISVLIGQKLHDASTEIIGIGTAPSQGLQKGVVVDIGKTVRAIKRAVQEAELHAGISIESATIGISGSHITSCNSIGIAPIKRSRVTSTDIDTALASARAIVVPEGHHILHVLPNYFLVDGAMVDDPLDMYGMRLEVHAHIILANVSCVQNLVKCCESAGVRVTDIVLEQLASAEAVLTQDERELGVAIIDIGGGTADVAVYRRSNVAYTMVVPVAGNHFTNDLAIGLRISRHEAERVKQMYGCVYCRGGTYKDAPCLYGSDIEITLVDGTHTTFVSHAQVSNILYCRTRELVSIIHNHLIVEQKLQRMIPAGIVLTGGGSLLAGMSEYTSELFGTPARIGRPQLGFATPQLLASPQYATGYGLLLYAAKKQTTKNVYESSTQAVYALVTRMRSWIADFW